MISKSGLHAIRALAWLARLGPEDFAGAATLAGDIAAPPNYLGKLLQAMATAGLVESRRGLGGGYRLTRSPREITLYEALDPIERLGRWDACLLGGGACTDERGCAVHRRWGPLRDAYMKLLRETTIADLDRPSGTPAPGAPPVGRRSAT